MVKGNLNIVKDSLRILVYDKNGQRINNPNIEWKAVNKNNWNSDSIKIFSSKAKIRYDNFITILTKDSKDSKDGSNQAVNSTKEKFLAIIYNSILISQNFIKK